MLLTEKRPGGFKPKNKNLKLSSRPLKSMNSLFVLKYKLI